MQTTRTKACASYTTRPTGHGTARRGISEEEYIRAGICPMCHQPLHFTGGCSFCHCCGWAACEG